jgi:hypothetical protein
VILVVATATLLALVLVFALSVRLIARLLCAEIAIILLMGAVLCAAILAGVSHHSGDLVRMLLIR